MIKKLKLKFLALSMSALFILLSVIVSGMNIINYASVLKEADSVLSVISQNKGTLPENGFKHDKLPPHFSVETPYESRYFTVFYSEENDIIKVDTSKIAAVDSETAVSYANRIINNNKTEGFLNNYRYKAVGDYNGIRITFLDCERRLESFKRFLLSSIIMSLLGFAIVFIVVFILSGRIIKPIAEAYEKQKRFITDAGHEIKTPLTIINANADILEMELTENNESVNDIKEQTKRLRELTESLVALSRLEESQNSLQKIDFPISEVVKETASAFYAVSTAQNKTFTLNIEPMLTLNGNDAAIRQLTTIFLDNAFKYSQNGGEVSLSLSKQNRTITLSVYNTTENDVSREQLKYVFDRFYRTDTSRNSETGGHGIGLSVAKAIVTAHSGKIKATTADGKSFTVTAAFTV